MVKTWGSADGGETSCNKCGARYRVTYRRFPVRDKDSYDCGECGEQLDSWNSTTVPFYERITQ